MAMAEKDGKAMYCAVENLVEGFCIY